MFNIGDLVIYSTHGICKIDDICEKEIAGVTRKYYEMHTIGDEHQQMAISAPVQNSHGTMMELMDKEDVKNVMASFKNPMMEKLENMSRQQNAHAKLVHSGDRKKMANVVNTFMRKKMEVEQNNKSLTKRDRDFLTAVQDSLFEELATVMNSSSEKISERVGEMIASEEDAS